MLVAWVSSRRLVVPSHDHFPSVSHMQCPGTAFAPDQPSAGEKRRPERLARCRVAQSAQSAATKDPEWQQ